MSGAPIPSIALPTSARDLIGLYFGVEIRIQHRESTPVATTTAAVIGQWARVRTEVSVCNNGTVNVALAFSSATVATAGYILQAGQTVTFTWLIDNELVLHDLWALASSGSQQLYVIESVLSGA